MFWVSNPDCRLFRISVVSKIHGIAKTIAGIEP